MVVALDYVGEPAGVGFGADEDEWRRRGQGFVRAGTAVADSERFQPPRLVDGGYLALWPHGDVGRPGNRPLDPEHHQAVACTGLREARP